MNASALQGTTWAMSDPQGPDSIITGPDGMEYALVRKPPPGWVLGIDHGAWRYHSPLTPDSVLIGPDGRQYKLVEVEQ